MMGHRKRLIDGDEFDALTRALADARTDFVLASDGS
jgi:hypothetical protein